MMKSKSLQILLPILALVLVLCHGLEDSLKFKVDWVSLCFLGLLALPSIIDSVEYVRFGDIEARFRALHIAEQTLMFLRGIAPKRQWTFYSTREEESHLGEAFRIVVQELVINERDKLIKSIHELLDSDNNNSRWLASEIIGYFKLHELRDSLPSQYERLSQEHGTWDEWQLNCLWAHSRFDNYREVHKMLATTTSAANQRWLLFVYKQMVIEEHAAPINFMSQVDGFLARSDITPAVREEAQEILAFLGQQTSIHHA